MRATSRVLCCALLVAAVGGCSYERPQYSSSDPDLFQAEHPNPTLEQAQGLHAVEGRAEAEADQNRYTEMRKAALSFGMRSAMAHRQQEISSRFKAHEQKLDRTFDFRRIVIPIKNNDAVIIPPVIAETEKSLSIGEDGKVATISQATIKIIQPARIAATAPRWKDYVSRADIGKVSEPPISLLPKTEAEQKNWAAWVAEGWKKGEQASIDNWEQDLARLKRDFEGMVNYLTLVEEGRVRALYLASSDLGITGEGTSVEIGKSIVKIANPAHLIGADGEYLPIIIDPEANS